MKCICLLAHLVIAIIRFRLYQHDSATASLRAEFAIHITLIQQRLESCNRGWVTMYSEKQGNYKKARTGDKQTKK